MTKILHETYYFVDDLIYDINCRLYVVFHVPVCLTAKVIRNKQTNKEPANDKTRDDDSFVRSSVTRFQSTKVPNTKFIGYPKHP